jgi:hypothetical protein
VFSAKKAPGLEPKTRSEKSAVIPWFGCISLRGNRIRIYNPNVFVAAGNKKQQNKANTKTALFIDEEREAETRSRRMVAAKTGRSSSGITISPAFWQVDKDCSLRFTRSARIIWFVISN